MFISVASLQVETGLYNEADADRLVEIAVSHRAGPRRRMALRRLYSPMRPGTCSRLSRTLARIHVFYPG
jgi:hypothetical protein